jgi:ornithine--oxo-acid transaminase
MNESLFCQAILMPLLTEHHILAQVAGHRLDVIKLIPALVLTRQDADRIVAALDETTRACSRFPGPAWEALRRIGANSVRRTGRSADPKRDHATTTA